MLTLFKQCCPRRKKQVFSLFVAIGILFAPYANAQQFSGRGITASTAREVDCIAEVTRLELLVIKLEEQRAALINCNEQGKVYDGTQCVDLRPPTADWQPTPANPGTLHFLNVNNTQIGNTIIVIRGRDGKNAMCPPGYEEE